MRIARITNCLGATVLVGIALVTAGDFPATSVHADTDAKTRSVPDRDAAAPQAMVVSWHHQAVQDPGRLRVVAKAPDGVIEAIDDPDRPFYLGVQWHPERATGAEASATCLNQSLIARFVAACLDATSSQ